MIMKLFSTTSVPFLDAAPARNGFAQAITGLVAGIRKAAADRALYRQLTDMDDALLRDIGLGNDEIYRIRQGQHVLPRQWR
jgi:uncharacterized protein YjiS (DUF1127 family)